MRVPPPSLRLVPSVLTVLIFQTKVLTLSDGGIRTWPGVISNPLSSPSFSPDGFCVSSLSKREYGTLGSSSIGWPARETWITFYFVRKNDIILILYNKHTPCCLPFPIPTTTKTRVNDFNVLTGSANKRSFNATLCSAYTLSLYMTILSMSYILPNVRSFSEMSRC